MCCRRPSAGSELHYTACCRQLACLTYRLVIICNAKQSKWLLPLNYFAYWSRSVLANADDMPLSCNNSYYEYQVPGTLFELGTPRDLDSL